MFRNISQWSNWIKEKKSEYLGKNENTEQIQYINTEEINKCS